MIPALWGVFVWKKYKSAPSGIDKLIASMFICFISGLALIIIARLT